ncbi:vesicle transport protein SFT2A-like [Phalaenopsis equestris]|uniref:vesicle transport protein SFT2A-like n=1 Tax=Phalaenopsis equestris TaxID=78828 RepID=UPI0009E446BA|nr:vesicle transport protein SFT2A-like [Phalaenopsis equestris]
MMDKLRRFQQSLLGWEEDQEDDFLIGSDCSCSLSPLQRLYAFAVCLVAGLAFLLLSLIVFARPIKFAVMFSFGNLLAIGSTAFLIGPVQQTRMMLDPVRIYATSVYIISVILALVCALWIHNKVLTLIVMVIEICALIWYSLSYIPFARRMVSELLISCCDTDLS